MKKIILFFVLISLVLTIPLNSQSVKVKNGVILVDKSPYAKIIAEKVEGSMGLLKDYTVTNMNGDLIYTAVYSKLIPEDPNNSDIYYFQFKFEGIAQPAYLGVSKLSTEKSVAKVIGKNTLLKNGELNIDKTLALIEKKGVEPPENTSYELVARDKNWPIEMRKVGEIEQNGKLIGSYKDMGSLSGGADIYEFFHPSGAQIARVTFEGGNNATTFLVDTFKDGKKHTARVDSDGYIQAVAAIDRNYYAIKRFIPWLIGNNYL